MMNSVDIVHMWNDQHRVSLIGEDLTELPQDSGAVLELSDTELEAVHAGWGRGWREDEDDEDRSRFRFGGWHHFGWGDRDDWWHRDDCDHRW